MVRGKQKQQDLHAYEPDYAVPPGRTLQETIDALEMDQRELAKRTGLSVKHVNQVIEGVASITQDNQFAANFLIPPNRAGELAKLKSSADVQAFARSLGIAPGTVVGRLQHEGIIEFSQLNGLKVRLEWSGGGPSEN